MVQVRRDEVNTWLIYANEICADASLLVWIIKFEEHHNKVVKYVLASAYINPQSFGWRIEFFEGTPENLPAGIISLDFDGFYTMSLFQAVAYTTNEANMVFVKKNEYAHIPKSDNFIQPQ